MLIDCNGCPGRPAACDGCMVQVLFAAPSSADAGDRGEVLVTGRASAADRDISSAIEVFALAAMVTTASARSARMCIAPVQGPVSGQSAKTLRAG